MKLSFDPTKGEVNMCFEPCSDDRYSAFLLKLVFYEELRKGTAVPNFDAETLKEFSIVEESVEMILSHDYFEFIVAYLGAMYRELENRGINATGFETFFFELERWNFGVEGWHPSSPTIH